MIEWSEISVSLVAWIKLCLILWAPAITKATKISITKTKLLMVDMHPALSRHRVKNSLKKRNNLPKPVVLVLIVCYIICSASGYLQTEIWQCSTLMPDTENKYRLWYDKLASCFLFHETLWFHCLCNTIWELIV